MISQPAVPETALKRRKRDEAWAAKKATADAEAAAASKKNSEEIFKRAEKYVKEYRDQVRFGETRRARVTQTHRFSRHRRDAARPLRDASGQTREATDVGARRVIRAKPRSRGGRGGGRPRPPASPPERSERSRWRFRALWLVARTLAYSRLAARRRRVCDRAAAGFLSFARPCVASKDASSVSAPPVPRSKTDR